MDSIWDQGSLLPFPYQNIHHETPSQISRQKIERRIILEND